MKNDTPSEVYVHMADNGFWWPEASPPGSNCIYATPHPPYYDQSIATRLIRRAFWRGIACEPVSMRSLKHLVRTRRQKNCRAEVAKRIPGG